MSTGWDKLELKDISILVPPGTKVDQDDEWKTLFTWDGLALGATILEVEIAGVLGTVRPTDIQSRWLRAGNDDTKRQTHTIGTIKAWADVSTYLEYINDTDQPIAYQLWAKGASITVVKIVAKSLNPKAHVKAAL